MKGNKKAGEPRQRDLNCTQNGCENKCYALDLCKNHYARSRRGTLTPRTWVCNCSGEPVTQTVFCLVCYRKAYYEKRRGNRKRYVILAPGTTGRECTECKNFKPFSDFYKRTGSDVVMSKCKHCMQEAQRIRKAQDNFAS